MSNKKVMKRPGGMGGGHMKMGQEKAKDFKGTMKKLISYLSPYKLAILLVIVFAIGSSVFNIVGPKILGNATTKIFEDLHENLIDTQEELRKAVTYIYNLDNIKSLEKYTYSERFAVYLIKRLGKLYSYYKNDFIL